MKTQMIWIGIILLILAVGLVAWWSKSSGEAELSPASPVYENRTSATDQPTILASPLLEEIGVGDTLAGFTVTAVEGYKVYLEGTVAVRGVYSNENEMIGPWFYVNRSDFDRIPHVTGDSRREDGRTSFCFKNEAYARQALGSYQSEVTITIKDYVIDLLPAETCDQAELLKVEP